MIIVVIYMNDEDKNDPEPEPYGWYQMKDKIMFSIMVFIVIMIIFVGYKTLTDLGPLIEYCRENPNATLYGLGGEDINCTDYLPTDKAYTIEVIR